MGFISSATTINIKGKLTPIGRQRLASGLGATITNFSLGDSDANYNVFLGLDSGEVPDFSGDNLGFSSNNGGINYQLRSKLLFKSNIDKKPVEPISNNINATLYPLGFNTVEYSGDTISQHIINRNDFNTDRLTNLFYSFGLPIDNQSASLYTSTLSNNGGFADTALSGISSDTILVIGIDGGEYGEIIDGKTLKIELSTTGNTYDIYGTYENKNNPLQTEDSRLSDISVKTQQFGPNTCLLFSDDIRRPNNDINNSWATGYGLNKPFSINGKKLWNFKTNPNQNRVVDKAVGIAYLDKGFIVITEPAIVNEFDLTSPSASATTITFNSNISVVSQKITCIADRNEFTISTNNTYVLGDVPRITEIGLYDNSGNLIAIAKTNRTYYKPSDDLIVFNLTIDF
jgi:hypothetical protein